MSVLLLRYWPHLAIVTALVVGALCFSHARYNAGYEAATAKMQRAVDTANELTRLADAQAAATTRKAAQAIEVIRNERTAETNAVLAAVQPVRLCKPAADRRTLPAATGPAPSTNGATAASEPPMRAGEDLRRPLVLFAAQCQRDLDDAIAWRDWYLAQAN